MSASVAPPTSTSRIEDRSLRGDHRAVRHAALPQGRHRGVRHALHPSPPRLFRSDRPVYQLKAMSRSTAPERMPFSMSLPSSGPWDTESSDTSRKTAKLPRFQMPGHGVARRGDPRHQHCFAAKGCEHTTISRGWGGARLEQYRRRRTGPLASRCAAASRGTTSKQHCCSYMQRAGLRVSGGTSVHFRNPTRQTLAPPNAWGDISRAVRGGPPPCAQKARTSSGAISLSSLGFG